MIWLAPLFTLLGTALGAGATLLADRIRWRRETSRQDQRARRDSYVVFLTAVQDANAGVRSALAGDHAPDESRSSAARSAFRGAGLFAAREQLALMAPDAVVAAADQALRQARQLRDLVIAGRRIDDAGYLRALDRFQAALDAVRSAMRTDLGTAPLTVELAL
ncbi:hypothetical protein [Amycolatopsis sp. WGS_07]|uniref:hypothetical protein n=1 Tax=Amycolatopsis sp. WGS_07 TaxID=3076764 RepID=UPI0038737175